MTTILLFVVLQILASGYSCWRGGAPERTVAALLVMATVVSLLSPMLPGYTYRGINLPLLQVDLALLAGLIAVAMVADRFWPMWLAAFQLVAIASHFVRVYDRDVFPIIYWWMASKAGYPMLLILVAGTFRHRRRAAQGMPEWAWTWQRVRHERGVGLAGTDACRH